MTERDQPASKGGWQLLWPLIVTVGQGVSGWRAEQNYRSLPQVLPASRYDQARDSTYPGVSIVVPARNEADNLPRLLDSLVTQDYLRYEILVIDDASEDASAAIALRYKDQGVRLIRSAGPPAGWTGKNAACWRGAEESVYPWLLFIDADTELAPSAVRSTIDFALQHHAGALSLFARQRCQSLWEQLLLPFAYQQYFVGMNVHRMHSKRGPALANGQFFLVKRAAYQEAGGHAANARSIIDDIALATRLKRIGVTPLACRGEALVAVRMYTSLRAITAGFGKNSYLFLRHSPTTGIQTAISTSLAASVLMLFGDAWRKRSWRIALLAVIAYVVQLIGLQPWLRRFGVRWLYGLLSPFSAPVFFTIALNSMLRGGSLPWKGRRYSFSRVRYRIPARWFMEMGRAMLFRMPRSIIDDSAYAVSLLPKTPCITGEEHIPCEGSFVLVSNHYQRLDLWIGWSAALMIDSVARKRDGDISIHYVTTDRARIGRFTVPGTRWLFERVAAVWDLVLIRPPALANEHVEGQRYALLRILRLLKRSDGRALCIGLMPEGDEGNTAGLIEAVPGIGRALYALSAKGLPTLPAAVWEVDRHLHIRFGEPFHLYAELPVTASKINDSYGRDVVMQHIAALLPKALRGKYGKERVTDGTLG